MFLSFDTAKVQQILEPGKFLIEFNPIEIICNFVKKKSLYIIRYILLYYLYYINILY